MPRFAAFNALLLVLSLIACSDASRHSPSVDPGLIMNPRFEPGEGAVRIAHWSSTQHAGVPSYEVEATDGTLVIRRIGKEPWALVSQSLDATELAGKQLEFSMELAGELDETYGPALEPAGLVVRIMGRSATDLPMMGKRHLLVMTDVPGLTAGRHAPARRQLRFQIPEGGDLELTVGVQLTLGGELRARAPQLRVINEDEAPAPQSQH
jgi:hypothetical protein